MYSGLYSMEDLSLMLTESLVCGDLSREQKISELNYYLETKRWDRYIQMFQSKFWPAIVLSLQSQIPFEQLLKIASEIWNSPQIDFLPCDFLAHILLPFDVDACQSYLMNSNEMQEFTVLPDSIRVFRSHSQYNVVNLSWSLDITSAVTIGKVLNYEFVSSAILCKEHVAALFTRRPNWEIILSPHFLHQIDAETISIDSIDL